MSKNIFNLKAHESGIFIKLIVIGGENIGKTTFLSKINALNSTENHNIKLSDKLPIFSNIKEYLLNSLKLFIQGFIPEPPNQIEKKIDPEEEFSSDEEIKMQFNVDFKNTKKSIINYILSTDNLKDIKCENIFVFMYDLSDYSSLEQLFIFFESLNNKFEMKNNDIKCFLIGNKNDRKVILNTEQNNKLSNFIKKSNFIRSFEISSKLSFNFNKFFQLFIEEILDKEYTYDKNKFIKILNNKSFFSKSNRNDFAIKNNNPEPGQYNINVYSFDDIKQRNECFDNKKNRFVVKIFADKKAPKFSRLRYKEIDEQEEENKLIYRQQKKIPKENFSFSHIGVFVLDNGNKGISLSGSKSNNNYNLLNERRKKSEERNKKLYSNLSENNLSDLSYNFSSKNINDEQYFSDSINRKRLLLSSQNNERIKSAEKYNKLMEDNKIKLNNNYKIKSAKIMSKYHNYNPIQEKKNNKKRYLDIIFGNNINHINSINNFIQKNNNKQSNENYPNMYDIRGNMLNPNIGKSITSRKPIKINNNNNAEFLYIKGDFDKINKKEYSGNYSPRIRDLVIKNNTSPIKEVDENKFEKYKYNRENNNEKLNNLNLFLNEELIRKQRHENNMKEIKEIEEEHYNFLYQKYYKNSKPIPDYNYIKNRSPIYSIQGKHEKKQKLSELYGMSIPIDKNENDIEYIINPNFNYLKPNLPSYSFGKQERFNLKNYENLIKNKNKNKRNDDKILINYYDNQYLYDEKKYLNPIQPISSNLMKDENNSNLNFYENYNINNFTEEISKNKRINSHLNISSNEKISTDHQSEN